VFHKSWDRLLKGEDWSSRPSYGAPRAFLGVSRTQEQDHRKGAEIDGVVPNSAAAKAGLKKGDIITKLNKDRITRFEDLLRFMAKRRPGETITIEVLRDDKTVKLKAKLGDRRSVN
jgi:S1-C subfamily serine protease